MPFPGHQSKFGWGVVRNKPWHFVGLFDTKAEADSMAVMMGPAYAVHHGEHKVGSKDFIWGVPSPKGTKPKPKPES